MSEYASGAERSGAAWLSTSGHESAQWPAPAKCSPAARCATLSAGSGLIFEDLGRSPTQRSARRHDDLSRSVTGIRLWGSFHQPVLVTMRTGENVGPCLRSIVGQRIQNTQQFTGNPAYWSWYCPLPSGDDGSQLAHEEGRYGAT